MRRYLVMLAILVIVVFGAGIALVPGFRGKVFGVVKQGQGILTGMTPAKTPDEAMTKFRDAIKKRDYKTAADVYCGGDYAEQMRKCADAATAMGEAIDNLRSQMDNKGYDSDKAKILLAQLEPFPLDITVGRIDTSGNNAIAEVAETTTLRIKTTDTWYYNSQFDLNVFRPLVRDLPNPMRMELRKEGPKSDEKAWRIYVPVSGNMRIGVQRLVDKHKTYVKALEKVKYAVVHEAMSKADFEERLRQELETAGRD